MSNHPSIETFKGIMADLPRVERRDLEFKEKLLESNKNEDIPKLFKELAALSGNHEGGYLIVGIKDNGEISGANKEQSLKILQKSDYLSQEYFNHTRNEASLEWHTYDGKDLCLISVEPAQNGVSVMCKDSSDNAKTYRKGHTFVRHGTRSEMWDYSDLNKIYQKMKKDLIAEFKSFGIPNEIPQNNYSSLNEYSDLLFELEDNGKTVELYKLMCDTLSDNQIKEFIRVLEKINTQYQNNLSDGYMIEEGIRIGLRISALFYALGAYAVKNGYYNVIYYLVHRPVTIHKNYEYFSLSRHAEVIKSRNSNKQEAASFSSILNAVDLIKDKNKKYTKFDERIIYNYLAVFDYCAFATVFLWKGQGRYMPTFLELDNSKDAIKQVSDRIDKDDNFRKTLFHKDIDHESLLMLKKEIYKWETQLHFR